MTKTITGIFDRSEHYWESKQNSRNMSYMLVAVFMVTLLIGFANHFRYLKGFYLVSSIDYNDAIEFSFNFLLFFEMIGLVFAIPKSISSSIAKQFQIMSLIFLRTSFEELSSISLNSKFIDQIEIISRMAAEASAALIIFFLTLWFYKLQKHRQITDVTEKVRFVNLKKLIAVGVFIGLIVSVLRDILEYSVTGVFRPSYAFFYQILIFADMLLMLAAFRYVIHYPSIFRYSAFVLITIFIRISLVAPMFYNVLIGIATVLFGIGVTYIHNLYLEGRLKNLNDTEVI